MAHLTVCSKCSSAWPTGTPFCSTCGSSLRMGGLMPAIPPPPLPPRTSGMAITGFVLSFVCGVLGLIFSLIGYFDCKKSQGRVTGEGLALAGIIISIVQLVGAIVMWVMLFRAVDDIDKLFEESEARVELHGITQSASQHFRKTGRFPTVSHPPTSSCCAEPTRRCREKYDAPPWSDIGHESWGSTRYRLGYESTPTTFTAIARGDTNCDGNEVTYRMTVEIVSGRPVTGMLERTGAD